VTIIITDDDVQRLLSMEECIEAMRVAFSDFAKGDAVNRPRVRYTARHSQADSRYFANVHVGAVPSYGIACVRAGSHILKPPSPTIDRRAYDSPTRFNWGVVILYSTETAEPLAFLHEFHLSGMRVGATTGMFVDQVARKDAATLGLFGTGKQATTALEAISCVRPITRVNVYSPDLKHRTDFALSHTRPGLEVIAVDDPRQVVSGADVICCATNAMKPVLEGDWLEDGQIVVTIANSDVTNKRSEVDRRTFERATSIIVNDWESVVENRQTELLDPIEDGAVARDTVHELGDLLIGRAQVSQPPRGAKTKGIIYFKNNSGLAIQFAAAGGVLYRKAMEQGVEKSIPKEWLGSDLSALYAAGYRPSP
jgi:alanine dehydrogenase